ncbi:MAG: hypothetical protein JW885_11405 [Deltaproteobacteria bacterium]|nr:hypothetical protein [Candidatus Zymogenaceae bacterium]
MPYEQRVDEQGLKAFLDQRLIDRRGEEWFEENRSRLDFEWEFVMDLFDPPSMYKKNPDGTFSVKDRYRFDRIQSEDE